MNRTFLLSSLALVVSISSFYSVLALTPVEVPVQVECFDFLKESINEVEDFAEAATELSETEYSEIEASFSPYYKNLSSFGIDLSEPLFDVRVYSFGKQTGYVHPPLSPYPTSARADTWEEAAKEHVILEEYVRDPNGNRRFLGCGYIKIESGDLSAVTRDRYVYDGELMSVLKTNTEYKAWYNQNLSFDKDGNHFVTWKRLFVYPRSTQGTFFNRYEVAEAFPSNQVESLAELSSSGDEEADTDFIAYESNGKIQSTSVKALEPVRLPENEAFPSNSYYRAIEAKFPEFSKQLSVRGLVSYPQMKRFIASREETNTNSVWSVLVDTRDVTEYYQAKSRGEINQEDRVFENMLDRIENIDQEVDALVGAPEVPEKVAGKGAEKKERTEKIENMTEDEWDAEEREEKTVNWSLFAALAVILIAGGILIKKKL